MNKLLFGTAGIPLSTEHPNLLNGIVRVKELELDCMEIEFVRNIFIKRNDANIVAKLAIEQNVALTCHAPFFINLNAVEEDKIQASIKRIKDSAEILYLCGGKSVAFHAGFYLKSSKEETFNKIKQNLSIISNDLVSNKINITLRPEIGGKLTQFGDLEELILLSKEVINVLPCIDFAHYHARYNGVGSYDTFCFILEELAKHLGESILKNMHIHVSGIKYSIKGEIQHINLKESDFPYKELIKALKKYNVCGFLISESPNIEEDALLLKNLFYN